MAAGLAAAALWGAASLAVLPTGAVPFASAVHAQEQPQITPVFFTGVVGGDSAQGRRVLLRWYAVEELIELNSAVIFRRDGMGNREKLTVVRRTRNPQLIQSIFHAPGADAARADMQRILEGVYGTAGNSPQEFVQYLVDFLDSGGPGDTATARRLFVTQYSYPVAIMEGLGFIDHVDPADGPFEYELWQGDAQGNAIDALGIVTIDATVIDKLPKPEQLEEVFLRGRDGVTAARSNHRRIFLNFQPGAQPEERHINFGYNIYRLGRPIQGGETFESVRDELVLINDVPVMGPSPIEGEEPDQTFLFADSGTWLDTESDDDLLTVGETHTYFAVARDLLGQEGHPSDPLLATVRDTFEPDTPRGLNVITVRVNDQPALEFSWLPSPEEDVAAYRVYRYQEYVNVGKPGPFADIGGMTEGLIADLPANGFPPDAVRLRMVDTIPVAQHEQIFWYSISAVDDHGNESAISPGVFGVIDDVEGPQAIGISEICTTFTMASISGSVALEAAGTQELWEPIMVLNRAHRLASSVRIWRVNLIITPGRDVQEVLTYLGEYGLDSRGPVYAFDGPLTLAGTGGEPPVYRFEMVTADGRTDSIDIAPPERWEAPDARAVYTINAGVGDVRGECDLIAIAQPETKTTVPGGAQPPVRLTAPCPDDTVSMRLLRSVNSGRTWDLVGEVGCDVNIADLVDHYHPDSLTRVRYSLVALDKHGNPGVPHYLPYDIMFLGTISPPAPIEAQALGANIPSQRSIRVTWQGPADPVEFYRVHIRPKAGQTLQSLATEQFPLEFSVAQARSANPDPNFSYDEQTGLFEMTTSSIDRTGADIEGDVEYEIQIEAVPHAGNSAYGSRKLYVHWENLDIGIIPSGTLRWAPRPLPPIIDSSVQYNNLSFSTLRGGSVLIPITSNTTEFLWPAAEPPLMVWRRRTDKPNQPWVAVTPYLPEIQLDGGGMVDDPFFHVQSNNIWALDSTGVVQGAEYRYFVMLFDPKTREILGLWGPYDFLALTPG